MNADGTMYSGSEAATNRRSSSADGAVATGTT